MNAPAHTDDEVFRGIHHAVAADATARAVVLRLARARAESADLSPEEAATLTDLAGMDAALLVENYRGGGIRPLHHLVAALTDLAVDGWVACSRLLECDPAEAMESADRFRG